MVGRGQKKTQSTGRILDIIKGGTTAPSLDEALTDFEAARYVLIELQ